MAKSVAMQMWQKVKCFHLPRKITKNCLKARLSVESIHYHLRSLCQNYTFHFILKHFFFEIQPNGENVFPTWNLARTCSSIEIYWNWTRMVCEIKKLLRHIQKQKVSAENHKLWIIYSSNSIRKIEINAKYHMVSAISHLISSLDISSHHKLILRCHAQLNTVSCASKLDPSTIFYASVQVRRI